MNINDIPEELFTLSSDIRRQIMPAFESIERVSEYNTAKVMRAFQNNKVSESCFYGTTGYGYDDLGRETLDNVYRDVFGAESALVRLGFVNGTHAISCALFALANPGETILSVSGEPYDTLQNVIGKSKKCYASLKYYGINYSQVDLTPEGEIDIAAVSEALTCSSVKAVILQRSRGYSDRKSISIDDMKKLFIEIRRLRSDVNIFVDNCYGEFTEEMEPTEVGADLIAGSLIKNPGGGIAPGGGYIAGRKDLVERAAYRLTCAGIGGECGATLGNSRLLFQGLFMAPHVVSQALKTAVFCAALMERLNISTYPSWDAKRTDIIQTVRLNTPEAMSSFCEGIQSGAPVDSFVKPIPWEMPGYDCKVIMADGSFIQGSSIEISADGPFRDPYVVYMQGGLTYESGKLALLMAAKALLDSQKTN